MVEELLLNLAQLAVAVLLSAIAAYLAFLVFQWFTRNVDEWEELRRGNAAVGVVLGAIVVAVAIVLRPALGVDMGNWDAGRDLFFRVMLTEAVQLVVGLVLAIVTLGLALLLFVVLTRSIDEIEELKKGNLAIAAMLAGVVIGVSLLLSQAVGNIMALVVVALF